MNTAGTERAEILINKSTRTLEVVSDGRRKTYRIALGPNAEGTKEIEGDCRTPEGEFYIFTKNPKSKYCLSLGISYPAVSDADRGLAASLIDTTEYEEITNSIAEGGKPLQKTALGGEIYIHGGGTASDWTEGCIALDDGDIREIFDVIDVGTRVVIRP